MRSQTDSAAVFAVVSDKCLSSSLRYTFPPNINTVAMDLNTVFEIVFGVIATGLAIAGLWFAYTHWKTRRSSRVMSPQHLIDTLPLHHGYGHTPTTQLTNGRPSRTSTSEQRYMYLLESCTVHEWEPRNAATLPARGQWYPIKDFSHFALK